MDDVSLVDAWCKRIMQDVYAIPRTSQLYRYQTCDDDLTYLQKLGRQTEMLASLSSHKHDQQLTSHVHPGDVYPPRTVRRKAARYNLRLAAKAFALKEQERYSVSRSPLHQNPVSFASASSPVLCPAQIFFPTPSPSHLSFADPSPSQTPLHLPILQSSFDSCSSSCYSDFEEEENRLRSPFTMRPYQCQQDGYYPRPD